MRYTVFTPTYNRKSLLERLYLYLRSEQYPDMEWIIVDDGSTDDTKEFVEAITDNVVFSIRYFFQNNKGKYSAFNKAIEEAKGDYFICIDSDDLYINHAFTTLDKYIPLIKENNAGLCYLSSYINDTGIVIGDSFPERLKEANLIDIQYKYRIHGDKGILHRTEVLKKYRFPIIESEKFITETVLYGQISKDYTYILINEIIELKDYQDNGLSKNYRKLMITNPKGALINYSIIESFNIKGIYLIKTLIGLSSTAFYLKEDYMRIIHESRHKKLLCLLTPIGFVYRLLCMKRFDSN